MQLFCIHCGSSNVRRFVDGDKNKYACLDCNHIESRVKGAQGDFEITLTPEGKVQHRSSVTLVVQNSKVLFLERRNYPYSLSFPGGHVMYEDEGDLKRAALRELREESGIIARPEDLIHLVSFPLVHQQCHASPDREEWNMYLLIVSDDQSIAVVTDEEHNGYTWIPLDKMLSLDLSLSANEAIATVWNRLNEELARHEANQKHN